MRTTTLLAALLALPFQAAAETVHFPSATWPATMLQERLMPLAQSIAETGTASEIAAMQYHEMRLHPSFKPDGTPANFVLNGLPRKPGAPFADPCVDDTGVATGTPRTYKAAAFQLDIKLNKAGWHFPQSRILSLPLFAEMTGAQLGAVADEVRAFARDTQ